jgi:hypothetical protein
VLYCAGIRVVGFLLGAAIGFLVILVMFQALEFLGWGKGLHDYRYWIAGFLALIVGVINVRLVMKFYLLLVGIAFGLLGLAYHQGILEPLAAEGKVPPEVEKYVSGLLGGVIFTVVFATAGVLLHRYLIILLSAAFGAYFLLPVLPSQLAFPALLPLLSGIGILVQLFLSQRWGVEPRSFRKDDEEEGKRKKKGSKKG